MQPLSTLPAFCILLPVISAGSSRRAINDPASEYLARMCSPYFLNILTTHVSLANSPFPCDQESYLENICLANGTTEIDFLAEQECLCNGSYFTAVAGCNACFIAHGYQLYTPEQLSSSLASLSTAECSPSPPYQGFTNLMPFNYTSLSLLPTLTLGFDKFPNNTAVSNYFTETGPATPGAITGSATARLTSFTNTGGSRYIPTSTPSGFGTVSGSRSSTPASSASASKSSTNLAAQDQIHIGSGILAALLGVTVLL